MKNVVITGVNGFIGKNLIEHLKSMPDILISGYDIQDDPATLELLLSTADFVFHLAGVNRPSHESEFITGNQDFTRKVLDILKQYRRKIPVLITSSTQAKLDNPYGNSKRQAETMVFNWAKETGGKALVYRLPNVFGKWCRPNYNSVVATFCYNVAHDLPIQVNDGKAVLNLVYIDDVIAEFIHALQGQACEGEDGFCFVAETFTTTVQELADAIKSFRESRNSLVLPNFENSLTRCLYATYLSYLPKNDFGYNLDMKHDKRGWLAEIIKSKQLGQIFVSRTKPGIIRGNHWHHTKVEKFVVIFGKAIIRFRQIHGDDIIEVPVSSDEIRVVDIPTGYTHSIENVGETDLITLFWSNQIFDAANPDTNFLEVLP